jgi:putative transposase
MSQSYSSVWLHFVWSTKNRQPDLNKKVSIKLFKYLKEIAEENNFYLDHVNGIEDHIHCLVSIKTDTKISDVAKLLKAKSSYWLNEQKYFDFTFDWQDGYAVFSVSPNNLESVRKYIQNQEAHHKQKTYEEELKWMKTIA